MTETTLPRDIVAALERLYRSPLWRHLVGIIKGLDETLRLWYLSQ